MFVLAIGFGTAFNICAPNFNQGAEFQLSVPGPLRPFAPHTLDLSAGGPLLIPFWAIFGFVEVGEVAAAPLSASITPLLLWICEDCALKNCLWA